MVGIGGDDLRRRAVLGGLLAAALLSVSRLAASAGRPEVLVHKSPT